MIKRISIILGISIVIWSCGSAADTISSENGVKTKIKSANHVPSGKTNDITYDYIQDFKEIAMQNMRDYKIPASIILAQGALESGAGVGALSKKSNNHFGIKCHKDWNGEKAYHDDDRRGECFRKYKEPSESYRDHALFLTTRSRYSDLFKLSPDDYEGWAQGLREAGYATDPKYPQKLINLIEKYNLDAYDAIALGKKQTKKSGLAEVHKPIVVEEKKEEKVVPKIQEKVKEKEVVETVKSEPVKQAVVEKPKEVIQEAKKKEVVFEEEFEEKKEIKVEVAKPEPIKQAVVEKPKEVIQEVKKKEVTFEEEFEEKATPKIQEKITEEVAVQATKPKEALMDEFTKEEIKEEVAQPKIVATPEVTSSESQYQELGNHNLYKVGKGDTLYNISRRYGVTVDQLVKLNKIQNNSIAIGQIIRIK